MTSTRSQMAVAVLALAGCKGGASVVDGPTGRDASIDAETRFDAGPDASGPRCSIAQPIDAETPTHSASVMFDVTVEGIGDFPGYGAKAMFADAQGARVFSRFRSFHVSLSGTVALGTDYPVNGDGDPAEIWDVAAGTSSFGAVFFFGDDEVRFCAGDTAAVFGTCTALPISAASQVPKVAFDGAEYGVFAVDGGQIRRWRFDETGAALGQADVWSANSREVAVADVFAANGETVAITYDGHADTMCETARARSTTTPAGRDLLPSEFGLFNAPAAAASGDVVQVLYSGRCLVGGLGPCSPAPGSSEMVSFSARVVDGVIGDPVPVPLDAFPAFRMFADGPNIMTFYRRELDVVLAGFSQRGELFARHVDVQLALDVPGAYIEDVYTATAVGPMDYLVAYWASTLEGPKTRVARVQLAPL